MGFREFITSFRYRRQCEAEGTRRLNLKPPPNPSRRYIDRLVGQLLNDRAAWDALRELKLIGPAIVPSLLSAIRDRRFHRAEWDKFTPMPPPLDSTLDLLVTFAPDEAARIALRLTKSPDPKVRRIAAKYLASAGRGSMIPILGELIQDEDQDVRSSVRLGIHRAVTKGCPDDSFRREAYDLLLSQMDHDWSGTVNNPAETVIALDPGRAAIDLAGERLLGLSNHNAYQIIEACNRNGILLPEAKLRHLLMATLRHAAGEPRYRKKEKVAALLPISERPCPYDYLAAAALRALAIRKADGADQLAQSLLDHENQKVHIAAAEALTVLAGIADPVKFVIDLVKIKGYEALSHVQRVVYCAFLFDAEVCNGGLMQFFGNSSGNHAVDTLQALQELKHPEAHRALQTAMQLVGPLSRESDRELRLTAFEDRWEELQPAFHPLERAYYETQVNLRKAWLLYATRHGHEFGA